MMKKILPILLVVLMLSFTGCSTKDSDYINEKGTVVVGVTDYMPMNYLDSEGEWTGFDSEFARMVFDRLGLDVKFTTIFWDEKIDDLNDKKIDCIWNGYTLNDVDNVTFSVPYAKNSQVFVSRTDKRDNYSDVSKISGIKVAVEKGSSSERVIKTLGMDVEVVCCDTQKEALVAVTEGKAEGCVVDKMIYNSLVHSNLAACVILNVEKFSIGFRNGSDMVSLVNKEITDMLENGELDSLAKKYEVELIK